MDILIAKGVKVRGALRKLLEVRTDGLDEPYQFLRAGQFRVLATGATAVRERKAIYLFDGQFSSEGAFYHPMMMGDRQSLQKAINRALRDSITPSNGIFLLGKITLGDQTEAALITDWLGQYPLYLWKSGDSYLISNNLLFLKILLPAATRSLWPAVDNLVSGGPLGESHLDGVELLPFGAMVRAGDSLRIERRNDHQSPGLSYREALETARSEIAGHIDSVFRAGGGTAQMVADITGGADTRAVLSFLLARGAQREFTVRCMGEYPNPDANVSGLLMETFGLKGSAFPHQGISTEKQVRYNAALSGGARDAGGTGWPVALVDLVHFKGSFGEAGGATPGADYIAMATQAGNYSAVKAADIFLQRRRAAGALDLATHEAIECVRARFAHSIRAMEEQGYARQHIIAETYLRSRCRTHFGLTSFLGNKSYILPSPLANRWLVEARRLLPSHLHTNNKVILDLILQNGQPELAFLPMANRKWSEWVVPPAYRSSWMNMQTIDFRSAPLSGLTGPLYRGVPIPDPCGASHPLLAGTKTNPGSPHLVQSRHIAPFQDLLRFFLNNLDSRNEVWRVFDRHNALTYVDRKHQDFRPNGIDTNAMGIALSGIAWSMGLEIPPQVVKRQELRVLAANTGG